MKHYSVISPTYEIFGGSWDPPEPPELGKDYIEVEANNKREAKIFAVKIWRTEAKQNPWERRYVDHYNDENPFAKLIVKELNAV